MLQAKCAKEGHHYRDCLEEVPRCVLCGGPHESFSRNCKTLHRGDMSSTLRILQLNVWKQSTVQQSLMNDEQLRDLGSWPSRNHMYGSRGDALIIVLTGHSNWTRMERDESGRAVRSMLWVRKDLEAEQVTVKSPELTATILRLPGRARTGGVGICAM